MLKDHIAPNDEDKLNVIGCEFFIYTENETKRDQS